MKRFLLKFLCVLTLFVSACDDAGQTEVSRVGVAPDINMARGNYAAKEASPQHMSASDRALDRSKFNDRRIAENHHLQFELEKDDLQKRYDRDFKGCIEMGCEIQNTNLNPSSVAYINAKIPPESLGKFLDFLAEGDGELKQHTVSADDRTLQFIDTEAKIKNLEALKARLLKLLDSEKVENVTQLLEVEKELSRVESELNSQKGQLRHLESITAMATVHVNYNVYSYEQQFEAESLKYSMRKSWQSFQNSISKVIIFTGAIVPWIPVFLIGLWLTFFAIRLGIGKARLLPRMFIRKDKHAVKDEPKPKAKAKTKT